MPRKFFLLIFFIFLSACGHESTKPGAEDTLTVAAHDIESSNFYLGIIQPRSIKTVVSPAEGVVQSLNFHYGDKVRAKDPLFIISSDKFQSEYKAALMQYIKTKTEFNNSKSQLTEAKFLHKHQLISDDDFKAKETNFYTAQLSILQAEDTLTSLLKQLNIKDFNLDALTIKDLDKIQEVFQPHGGMQRIYVLSPADGFALLPVKNDNADNTTKKIAPGDVVKQGEVLAVIGDMQDLAIHINVNEFNIHQLQLGQKVQVTGTAFPQYILQGEIANIDKQAQGGPNGTPVFSVEIVVKHLTAEQMENIHVGMSAKVEVKSKLDAAIMVPIQAVRAQKNVAYVKVIKNNQQENLAVKTGITTPTGVIVKSNLRPGDRIVLPHKTQAN